MHLRSCTPTDRAACLAIFASNVPTWFAAHEEPAFAAFLDRLPCPFFVVEDDQGQIMACGGHYISSDPTVARLAWGMVHSDRHHQGVGRFLLRARLEEIRKEPGVRVVELDTSQHSSGFFAREGFVVTETIPDGHAPGIDCCKMRLMLE